jgi:D-alanyl-D-alanine dipeptidase
VIAVAALLAALTYGPQHLPPVSNAEDPLVDASALVPGLIVRLAYAGPQNFTGHALYPADAKCLLRRSVAQRLAIAAASLRKQGLRLVARDCTRPAKVQAALWKAHPHPGGVADPELADAEGRPVALPTPFDDFGPAASADAPLPEGPAKAHREALKRAMYAAGFRVNPKEWWHYSRLYGWRWPLAEP